MKENIIKADKHTNCIKKYIDEILNKLSLINKNLEKRKQLLNTIDNVSSLYS